MILEETQNLSNYFDFQKSSLLLNHDTLHYVSSQIEKLAKSITLNLLFVPAVLVSLLNLLSKIGL